MKPDPNDAATARFIDALSATTRHPSTWDPAPAAAVVRSWTASATSIRTATDLVSTHRDSSGNWRTPEAADLDDPSVRTTALANLAVFADTVLAAGRDLGLRCGQAGVPWPEVDRRLPDLERARAAAQCLARAGGSNVGGWSIWAALEVARPRIRTDDPVIELGDRILRLRQTAWQLNSEQHTGMTSLTDFAAAGVIIHTHLSAYLNTTPADEAVGLQAHSMSGRVLRGHAAWSLVHLQTRQLRTAARGLAVVRDDLLAVRDLCQRLLPITKSASRHEGPDDPRRFRSLVNGSMGAFADIAGWNAGVVDELASHGQLYVAGHRLTGDEVTDDPFLVEAKLKRRYVRAPAGEVQSLAEAYAAARAVVPASSAHDDPTTAPVAAPASIREGVTPFAL